MRYLKLLALILTALLAVGCAPTSVKKKRAEIILPPGTLNKAEVTALFVGKTAESETGSGRISVTYYDPNGEARQLQYNEKRTGHWRIRDDGRICLQLEDGDDQCRIIVKEKGVYKKYIVKKNNRHKHVVTYRTFKAGNPLGL